MNARALTNASNRLTLGEAHDTLFGPWTDVTNTSPYAVSAANAAKFYRAVEAWRSWDSLAR